MLTTLPLLAFGTVSPLAAGVGRRLGIERSLLVALVLICLGIGLRSLPSTALLFGGTAIIGCGIALGNVLLPGLIKRDFSQHVAVMTGAYSITMGGAAALGSAMVVPLALAGFGWHGALLMLMVFPLLALLVWLPQTRKTATAPLTGSGAMHNRGIWRSALAAGHPVPRHQLAGLLRYYWLAAGHSAEPWLQRSAGGLSAWFAPAGHRRPRAGNSADSSSP